MKISAATPQPINIAPKICAACVGGIRAVTDSDNDDGADEGDNVLKNF